MRARARRGLWRRAAPGLLLLALLLGAGGARGGEPRQQVDVDARDQPLREVLAGIATQSGHALALDPRVDARVTLSLRQVGWRDAVTFLAERAGCEVQELPGGTLYLTRPPRISVQLSGAEIQTALLLLARLGKRSIVIGPEVRGRVTLELRDVSWARALRAVATTHGFAVVEDDALWTVGEPRGAAAPRSEAEILAGTFRGLEAQGLRLEREDGEELLLELPPDGPGRRRLQPGLERLRPGDRVAVSLAPAQGRLVLADLVSESAVSESAVSESAGASPGAGVRGSQAR